MEKDRPKSNKECSLPREGVTEGSKWKLYCPKEGLECKCRGKRVLFNGIEVNGSHVDLVYVPLNLCNYKGENENTGA